MIDVKNKVNALLVALMAQLCIAGLIFVGGLFDPLWGLSVVGIYFFVVGFYLMYHYLLVSFFK